MSPLVVLTTFSLAATNPDSSVVAIAAFVAHRLPEFYICLQIFLNLTIRNYEIDEESRNERAVCLPTEKKHR